MRSPPLTPSRRVTFSSVNTHFIIPGIASTTGSEPCSLYAPALLSPANYSPASNSSNSTNSSIPSITRGTNPGSPLVHGIFGAVPSSPPLYWDVSFPPLTATSSRHSISQAQYNPATDPPSQIMILKCREPGEMVIRATNGMFVTVEDVMNGLFSALQTQITQQEYARLPSDAKQRAAVAYDQRCRNIRDRNAQAYEKQMGVKKIDLLSGNTKFGGLTHSSKGHEYWHLHLHC